MDQEYAHVVNAEVVNVIVLDPDEIDPAQWVQDVLGGGELVDMSLYSDQSWGIGWKFDQSPVPPPSKVWSVDRDSIPADGITKATVTYANTFDDAPASVTFTVNGATKVVSVTAAGHAILDVVSSTPGDVIDVSVDDFPGQTLTITVES